MLTLINFDNYKTYSNMLLIIWNHICYIQVFFARLQKGIIKDCQQEEQAGYSATSSLIA